MAEFRWTEQRELAAGLVAEDRLTDEEIAARLGKTRRALAWWKLQPEFLARVAEIVAATRAAVEARGIADRVNRVNALDDRWRRMRQVVAARAAAGQGSDEPGASTGLLARTVKSVRVPPPAGSGLEAQSTLPGLEGLERAGRDPGLVEEWVVDVGLLREMRETEKQAAIEVGDWEEKERHTGSLLVREYVGVDLGEV